MPESPLSNCTVVITRPTAQAETLAGLIRNAGGEPVLFPLLAIEALDDDQRCNAAFDALSAGDWLIFISSNAVQHGMPRLLSRRPELVRQLQFAAIGPATAAEIRRHADVPVLTPTERYDSENFLAMPAMQQVAGLKFVIVRGVGGRELLADTLRARGAAVDFAECYRRTNPQYDAGDLQHLWQNKRMQAIVVTSSEAMRHLIALTDDAHWLQETPIFVNHARIASLAQQHGLQAVLAEASSDEAMLQSLINYHNKRARHD